MTEKDEILESVLKRIFHVYTIKFKGKIAYRTSAGRHYAIAKVAQQKHQSLSKILDLFVDAGLEKIHHPMR